MTVAERSCDLYIVNARRPKTGHIENQQSVASCNAPRVSLVLFYYYHLHGRLFSPHWLWVSEHNQRDQHHRQTTRCLPVSHMTRAIFFQLVVAIIFFGEFSAVAAGSKNVRPPHSTYAAHALGGAVLLTHSQRSTLVCCCPSPPPQGGA